MKENVLKEKTLTIPEIGLIAATRLILGVGLGLLIAERLNKDQRKAAGVSLLTVGVLISIPIGWMVLGKKRTSSEKPIALVA